MKVLIIGSGGREHALAWKISQSNKLSKLYCAPSNSGIEELAEIVNIAVEDIEELLSFVKSEKIDLTVVGPEVPLALGIVDLFENNGLKIFGPSQNAAMIETSKIFAKDLMQKYGIPTARYKVFDDLIESLEYLEKREAPIVIKLDGLAAGKGVSVCFNKNIAEDTLKSFFTIVGQKLVIEDFISGRELSLFALCDGNKAVELIPAQDYKPVFEGNKGPNTGGMGAYAPVRWVNQQQIEYIKENIINKTLNALKAEGIIYKGLLYCGLIISDDGEIKVLEFNCRFGDPETQVILPLLEDDLLEILYQVAEGKLKVNKLNFSDENCMCVVLTSGGYPGEYEKGLLVNLPEEVDSENSFCFVAGAKRDSENKLVTSGGRVLNIISKNKDLKSAKSNVYNLIKDINFENMHFREDIAQDVE